MCTLSACLRIFCRLGNACAVVLEGLRSDGTFDSHLRSSVAGKKRWVVIVSYFLWISYWYSKVVDHRSWMVNGGAPWGGNQLQPSGICEISVYLINNSFIVSSPETRTGDFGIINKRES